MIGEMRRPVGPETPVPPTTSGQFEHDGQLAEPVHEGMLVQRKPYSPEKIVLGPGSEVIIDATDEHRTVALQSAEGRHGLLVATEKNHLQFLEMPSGLFSAEHAHPFGFIVYTVRGRWVVSSYGRRCVMGPGSVYMCRANVPMGMEVPFEEGAFVLFFLEGGVEVQRKHERYLQGVSKGRIRHEAAPGASICDLPRSHPARAFAEKVNPVFFGRPLRDRPRCSSPTPSDISCP